MNTSSKGHEFLDTVKPFCNGKNKDFFLNNNYDYPKKINIKVKRKNSWYQNLLKLYLYQQLDKKVGINSFQNQTRSPVILRQYFNAEINVFYNKNIKCKFKGRIRLHGSSYYDHNNLSSLHTPNHQELYNIFPSIRIKLDDGHINHSNDFSLLIPKSRHNENEIINSQIFREIGFISPDSFFLNASLNGNNKKVIFLDRDVKNILTFNKKRPGPYIATNKRTYFKDIGLSRFRGFKEQFYSAKDISFEFYLQTLDRFNFLLINNLKPFYTKNYLNDYEKEKFKMFVQLAYSTNSCHTLEFGDLRFYTNVYYNEFEPIFYDGMGNLFNNPDTEFENSDCYAKINESHLYLLDKPKDQLLDILNKINVEKLLSELRKRGIEVKKKNLINYLKDINKNLNLLNFNEKTQLISHENKFFQDDIKKYNEHFKLAFHYKNKIFEICDTLILYCLKKKFNEDELVELFSNQIARIDGYKIRFLRINKNVYLQNKIELDNKYNFLNIDNGNDNIIKLLFKDIKSNFNKNTNVLSLKSVGDNSKVFIKNSSLNNIKIYVDSCLTIDNSYLNKVQIFSNVKNQNCKNAVHFVNSFGNLDKIENSSYEFGDNLDFDLSNIIVKNIKIESSSNDCLGVKDGNYEFIRVNLYDCKDKSLSIGDKSNVYINDLSIKNDFELNKTKAEIVIKNSSYAKINKVNIQSNNLCAAVYRKNNSYGGSKLTLKKNNFLCKTDVYEHADSKIIYE